MFKMKFKTANDAFRSPCTGKRTPEYVAMETKRILEEVTQEISTGITSGSISDINGNKIGEWSLK
jgi:hypothetical protein